MIDETVGSKLFYLFVHHETFCRIIIRAVGIGGFARVVHILRNQACHFTMVMMGQQVEREHEDGRDQ